MAPTIATGTIATSDVASAPSCDWDRKKTRPGTKITPPPTPSSPLDMPAAKPITRAPMMSTSLIVAPPYRLPGRSQHQQNGRDDEEHGEQPGDRSRRDALLQRGPREHPADRRHADQDALQEFDVAEQPVERRGAHGDEADRRERRSRRHPLVVGEPQ